MSSEKASFYSRDVGPFTTDTSDPTKKKYMGEQRRRTTRRVAEDRRGDVRFDLNNSDRRELEGRRNDDLATKFW